MLKTVSSYLIRLGVYHLSNTYFWKQHLEWKGTLHACQVFSLANPTGMEKTQTLLISKLHGHIIKWKKQYLVGPLKVRTGCFIVRQGLTYWREETYSLVGWEYLQPQIVKWCRWWKDWRPPIVISEPSVGIVIQVTLHFLLHSNS